MSSVQPNHITIEDYSERAIAVFGDTKPISDRLSAIQGSKFNPSLRGVGESKRPGWIFPKTRRVEVETLLQAIQEEMKQGSFKPAESLGQKVTLKTSNSSTNATMDSSLLSRIELLEAKVETLTKALASLKGPVKTNTCWADEQDESEEEKQVVKPKSLLRSVVAKK